MSKYILSTMTHSVSYAFFDNVGDTPVVREKVTIHGGATLPSYTSGIGEMTRDDEQRPMWTADGVVTPISDANYEKLKNHKIFKQHMDQGFLKVLNHDITGSNREISKHVNGMAADGFRQLTPATIKSRLGKHLKIRDNADADDNRL